MPFLWNQISEKMGVITGCNQRHEWMLKPFCQYYFQTNPYPLTFMDFGMSQSARLWCETKGSVLSVDMPKQIPTPKEKIAPKLKADWEKKYHDVWKAREGWFFKPFALLQTPYKETIWIDIDTFVIKPLTPLFEKNFSSIGLVKEVERVVKKCTLLPRQILYATGIIRYVSSLALIEKWVEKVYAWNHLYLGDQDILSRLIYEEKAPVHELPHYYNARPQDPLCSQTVVVHLANRAKEMFYYKY